MNYDFLSSIPWRLGSLAGLLVGGIAIAYGVTDYVVILFRIGIAFLAFYILGAIAAAVLRSVAGVYSIQRPGKGKKKLPVADMPDMAEFEEMNVDQPEAKAA